MITVKLLNMKPVYRMLSLFTHRFNEMRKRLVLRFSIQVNINREIATKVPGIVKISM